MATVLIMALPEESQNRFENANIQVHYCGLGSVKAAFKTQQLIQELKPVKILNLGTAGSFKLKQGTLVECSSFIQRFPEGTRLPGYEKLSANELITDLPKAICGSGDFIEKNKNATCDIFDMEAYSMAFVCRQNNVSFHSIKFITDASDENTFKDWKENLNSASKALFEVYQKFFYSIN